MSDLKAAQASAVRRDRADCDRGVQQREAEQNATEARGSHPSFEHSASIAFGSQKLSAEPGTIDARLCVSGGGPVP
jgi:hypothetical protein